MTVRSMQADGWIDVHTSVAWHQGRDAAPLPWTGGPAASHETVPARGAEADHRLAVQRRLAGGRKPWAVDARSLAEIRSAQATGSGAIGLPASRRTLADPVSTVGQSAKSCPAGGLRRRFLPQMNSTWQFRV